MDRSNQEDFKKQQVRVGFYDLEETIGKGNFAVVKLARHRITKSRVCYIYCSVTFNFFHPSHNIKVYSEDKYSKILKFLTTKESLVLVQIRNHTNFEDGNPLYNKLLTF